MSVMNTTYPIVRNNVITRYLYNYLSRKKCIILILLLYFQRKVVLEQTEFVLKRNMEVIFRNMVVNLENSTTCYSVSNIEKNVSDEPGAPPIRGTSHSGHGTPTIELIGNDFYYMEPGLEYKVFEQTK